MTATKIDGPSDIHRPLKAWANGMLLVVPAGPEQPDTSDHEVLERP